MPGRHVAVIGAGVVGLACAALVQQRGHRVTLIDPRPPGEYCSLGNAGCFSRASCVPLGLPGAWKKVPGWLSDAMGPLSIPLRYAHRIAPWLWRLHRATSPRRVNEIADALHPLLTCTLDKWRPLAAWAGVPELIVQKGHAFAYEGEASFLGDALGRELRQARGVEIEVLTGAAIRAYEPALSDGVTHLVVMPEQGHCPNPLRLSQALAARLRDGGAGFVRASALGFELHDGRVSRVRTDDGGAVEADTVVIAAGAHSLSLTRAIGTDVPLETERGYHAMLADPTVMPQVPVCSGEGKYFCTPMEGGLRVAGSVELAGLDAPPNMARADALLALARRMLPGLGHGRVAHWMGHRPSLPDSLPVIARAPQVPNVVFAFGHGHVGLTAAAPTAELVADLIDDRPGFMDLQPFSPARFG